MSGSKNAALPLMAASLLCQGETVLTNVPHIRDTEAMLKILDFLGAQTHFEGGTMRISTDHVKNRAIPAVLTSRFRASILLMGPLLGRFGEVEMAYPGGCVLGKRSVQEHVDAFTQLGAKDKSTESVLCLEGHLRPGRVILPKFSVTATENTLLACSVLEGKSRIDLAACEPHVRDLCLFLRSAGANIVGDGSHTLVIEGKTGLKGIAHRVIADDLEAGSIIAAVLATRGDVILCDIDRERLLFFLETVRRAGGVWEYAEKDQTLRVRGDRSEFRGVAVDTNIFPGFPTDLLPPLGVVLTQAKGVSRLFERLYERRMAYLYELEKMGAHVEFLNAHQALIIGPTPLKGSIVGSNDIRAGAAMVVAALCARGETTITDVQYIERGYDRMHEKLRGLGADIERIAGEEGKEKGEKIMSKEHRAATIVW